MDRATVAAIRPGEQGNRRKLSTSFFCRFLNRDIQVSHCMDNYVNANALNIKNSPCYKCGHGLKLRAEFSQS